MKPLLAVLLLATVAQAVEVEIAEIKVQRRDPVEFAWGEENDVDELTYSVNGDGTASLFIGTEYGTKRIVDPDAIRVVKPYRLSEGEYVVYPVQPADATQPVITVGNNAFSLWNYISGSTTNYTGKPGATGGTRTIRIRSLNDSVKVCRVEYSITNTAQHAASTTGHDEFDDHFSVEHSIEFSNGYINMNDSPPACVVSNFVVWGYAGSTDNTTIDTSVVDITVKEQDGRQYQLGRMHQVIEGIHRVQDRWAYYPAATDASLDDHRLYLDHDRFNYVSSDGDLGGSISTDIGPILSWDRGNLEGGTLIKGFVTDTNGTVRIYVTTKFGGSLTVLASSTVNGTFSAVSTTNNGIVDWNGGKAYELVASEMSGSSGFYKVMANVSENDSRGPSITIHPDTLYFGPSNVELRLIELTIGDTILEVLGRVKE